METFILIGQVAMAILFVSIVVLFIWVWKFVDTQGPIKSEFKEGEEKE